jgi:DNA-binding MarR family transcriptional regulator
MLISCACNCQRVPHLADDSPTSSDTLLLEDFVPFRLNRLADAVSVNLSEIYRRRFGLEIPEWRVLVTLGARQECTAQHIALSTRMHKTRVSRAVAALKERKLIARASNVEDGREMRLYLTKAGAQIYAALVPLAREREHELLSCLSDSQRRAFTAALSLLEESLGLNADE